MERSGQESQGIGIGKYRKRKTSGIPHDILVVAYRERDQLRNKQNLPALAKERSPVSLNKHFAGCNINEADKRKPGLGNFRGLDIAGRIHSANEEWNGRKVRFRVPMGLLMHPDEELPLQQRLDFGFQQLGGYDGLEAGDHTALPVNQELGEIPLDVGIGGIVRIGL